MSDIGSRYAVRLYCRSSSSQRRCGPSYRQAPADI